MEAESVIVHRGEYPPSPSHIRFVCLSDTHSNFPEVPPGDVLIHSGDFCRVGTLSEVVEFNRYIASKRFTHKIVVAGNHDYPLDTEGFQEIAKLRREIRGFNQQKAKLALNSCVYLEDSMTQVEGYRI